MTQPENTLERTGGPLADNKDKLMLGIIIDLVTPLLMTAGLTDISLARIAARQAIEAYRAQAEPELVSAAQIFGFGICSLDSLRLSARNGASINQKLRLRGNANGLSRSSQRANTTLTHQRQDAAADPATAEPDPIAAREQAELINALAETTGFLARARAEVEAEKTHPHEAQQRQPVTAGPGKAEPENAEPKQPEPEQRRQQQAEPPKPEPQQPGPQQPDPRQPGQPKPEPEKPAPQTQAPDKPEPAEPVQPPAAASPTAERDRRLAWATAMTQVAREFSANISHLPRSERRQEMTRIKALNAVARTLAKPVKPLPAPCLATWMASRKTE